MLTMLTMLTILTMLTMLTLTLISESIKQTHVCNPYLCFSV